MKKKILLAVLMTAQCAIFALPELNPAEPALLTQGIFKNDLCDYFGVKFGYVGDFLFDDQLESVPNDQSRNASSVTNSGMLSLNFWDRIDLYGSVGSYSYDSNNVINGVADIVLHSTTKTHWGVGIKGVIWEGCWGNCGTTYLGANIQYGAAIRNPVDRVSVNGATATHTLSYRQHSTQIGIGVAHKIGFLVPYVGGYWVNTRADAQGAIDGTVARGAKSSEHYGWYFGTTLVDACRMSVTAEARFIAETALSISADLRF